MPWRGGNSWQRPVKAARLVASFASHPAGVARALPGEMQMWYRMRHGGTPGQPASADPAWEEHLHALFEAPWPCHRCTGLAEILADIARLLAERGLRTGRATYAYYSDAEAGLCRAVWDVLLHRVPQVVVETGVAHGITSRVVLEGLCRNDAGHLWSIDLPFPFDRRLRAETGVAVPQECRRRWTYLEGPSRRLLPGLAAQVGHIELFIHDSLHTTRNTMFEMEQVAAVLAPGGVMVIDDIGSHRGFEAFARRHKEYATIICPADDTVGLFGIAVKPA